MGLLDTLSDRLSSGVDRVRFEADKFQRTSRISGEISNMKSQVDTNMRQLGERAFSLHQQGKLDAPEVASLTQIITQLQAQQADKERELGEAQSDTFELWLARQPQPTPSASEQGDSADSFFDQTGYSGSNSGTPAAPSTGPTTSTASSTMSSTAGTPPFAGATGGQAAVDAAPYACANCGFALPANAVFCPNCGTRTVQA